MTLAEKILAFRCNLPVVKPGQILMVPVDCAAMTDILGPRIIAEAFHRLGKPIFDKERVVIICDHYSPSSTEQQAEIVKFSREWAREYGIENFYELEGPCHQVLAEQGFARPGTILVGTDSHSCTAGAFGCFGTGIGSTEMLGVLIRGEIWMKVPESIKIEWHGTLKEGVMAKDLILYTIGQIGHAGATYNSMEFCGDTIEGLPMDERMCISNMAVEAGAKVGLIAADEITIQYLGNHGVEKPVICLKADANAKYKEVFQWDASLLRPMVSCPNEVDHVVPVSQIKGLRVDQVYIGSCTGGRLSDLQMAATILKGKKVASGCRLLVSPASRSVWIEALKSGILETLAKAGASILAPSCGACLGLHSGTLGAREVCVSTTNRNFVGRMGSVESKVYLTSAATAAATALTGMLTGAEEYLCERG